LITISALPESLKAEYRSIFGLSPQDVKVLEFALIQALKPLASARILLSPIESIIELHSYNGDQSHLEILKKVMLRWTEVYLPSILVQTALPTIFPLQTGYA
jgi:hypothetical protein